MLYMSIHFCISIMFIIVMVVSRDIVSHVTGMSYFLCAIIAIIKTKKFSCFRYMFALYCVYTYKHHQQNHNVFFRFGTVGFMIINNISCVLVYVFRYVLCYWKLCYHTFYINYFQHKQPDI